MKGRTIHEILTLEMWMIINFFLRVSSLITNIYIHRNIVAELQFCSSYKYEQL